MLLLLQFLFLLQPGFLPLFAVNINLKYDLKLPRFRQSKIANQGTVSHTTDVFIIKMWTKSGNSDSLVWVLKVK